MYFAIFSFLCGVVTIQLFSSLPHLIWLIILILITLVVYYFTLYKIIGYIFIFLLGLIWITWQAGLIKVDIPDSNLLGKPLLITGTVISLPEFKNYALRFEFRTIKIAGLNQKKNLMITWYGHVPKLGVGDQWQLEVKLRLPKQTINPGTFDYSKWLFSHRIQALAIVKNSNRNILIKSDKNFFNLDHIRQHLAEDINQFLGAQNSKGLVVALITGFQGEITESQWQVMRATGTNHLMAIAGLHIGFLSSFIYLIMNIMWRRSFRLIYFMPAQQAAAISALVIGIIYSALAGFSLPTQRAVMMMSIIMLGTILRKNLHLWQGFYLAVFIVLLIEPLSILTISFWLSFIAVALIFYGISGRLRISHWVSTWSRIQWILALGLLPVTLWLFGQASLVSYFANAIAVPVVGFLVLPCCLFAVISFYIFPILSKYCFIAAAKLLELLWYYLTGLAHLKVATWHENISLVWILLSSMVGVLLILAPRGYPNRTIGLIWLLPLFFSPTQHPKRFEIWLNILNVRSGMAIVLQSHSHILIFDDEGGNKKAFNMQNIIIPFLHYKHIQKVDLLLFKNKILDSFLAITNITIIDIPMSLNNIKDTASYLGWRWDNINFNFRFINDIGDSLRIIVGQQRLLIASAYCNKISNEDLLTVNTAIIFCKQNLTSMLNNPILEKLPTTIVTNTRISNKILSSMKVNYINIIFLNTLGPIKLVMNSHTVLIKKLKMKTIWDYGSF